MVKNKHVFNVAYFFDCLVILIISTNVYLFLSGTTLKCYHCGGPNEEACPKLEGKFGNEKECPGNGVCIKETSGNITIQ